MRTLPKFILSAAMVTVMATSFSAVQAATPADTLVQAWQMDDIISLDPAEIFELSASEINGNTYERLITYDIKDVSKISGQVAESWTVSPDGKTYTFKIKPNKKFASGSNITAEDVVYSLHRAVSLDKSMLRPWFSTALATRSPRSWRRRFSSRTRRTATGAITG
ncbi:MAG: transporter substrate-binding protein [Microvirga sp.]|nr:transporter substrate-binding protein [Microvirga sp.]